MAPYPTAYEIEDIYKYRESPDTMKLWDERLAKNINGRVMGHDHYMAGEHKGVEAWKENIRASMSDMLDTSKSTTLEVVNVIGGGESPWAAVETVVTGKAKSGKKWHHEHVAILRFNLEGKITTMRCYMDSAHVNDHVEEYKKTQSKS